MDQLRAHRATPWRHSGVRALSCAEQFRALAFAQLTWRESLRDIVASLSANAHKLYAMGFHSAVKRSTLADANESRDWRIRSDLAALLIRRARKLYANDALGVDLDSTVYALDSGTIDLCLSLFEWAPFRSTKAAIKLHTLLDLRGAIPAFIHISDGKLHDVNVLDLLAFEAGAFYVMESRLRGLRQAARIASGRRVLRHAREVPVGCPACVLGSHRPQHWRHQRPAGHDQRALLGNDVSRTPAPCQVQGSRVWQDADLPDQQHGLAGADDCRAVQESLAGRAVLRLPFILHSFVCH